MEAEVVGATGAGAKGGTKDQSPIAVFLRGEFAKLKEAAIKDEQEKLAAQAAMYEKKLEQQKGEYEKMLEREEHEMEEETIRLREELERSLADAAESATRAREVRRRGCLVSRRCMRTRNRGSIYSCMRHEARMVACT